MELFYQLKQRTGRVLFVCLGNSYRSRMAEAFANSLASDVIEARSAGLAPARRLSRTAQRLMREKGMDIPDSPPRKISVSELEEYDLIVNLCEYGLPKTSVPVLKAPLPDPVGLEDEEQREIRDRIQLLVETLAAQFRQAREEWPWRPTAPERIAGPTWRAAEKDLAMLAWWRQRPALGRARAASVPAPDAGLLAGRAC